MAAPPHKLIVILSLVHQPAEWVEAVTSDDYQMEDISNQSLIQAAIQRGMTRIERSLLEAMIFVGGGFHSTLREAIPNHENHFNTSHLLLTSRVNFTPSICCCP